MKKLELQCEVEPGNIYSFRVDEDAMLKPVDLGQVIIELLAGFTKDAEVKDVDLQFPDFWKEPEKAMKMYPVFEAKDGTMVTFNYPITSVGEIEE